MSALLHRLRRTGQWLAVGAGLVALFYAEENYRGERAWQTLKREVLAKGQRLDPSMFGHSPGSGWAEPREDSGAAEWFLRDGPGGDSALVAGMREASRTFDLGRMGWWGESRPTDLKEWRDYFRRPRAQSRVGDETDASVESWVSGAASSVSGQDSDLVPLILIDDVPLEEALGTLARQAGVELRFAGSALELRWEGRRAMEMRVSIRFESVTAREALEALLQSYGLDWTEGATVGELAVARALAPAPEWPMEAAELSTMPLGPDADTPLSVVSFDEVPALDAVRNVARHAGLNFQFDSEVLHREFEATCSLRLTNVTTRTALGRVLEEFGLAIRALNNSACFMVVPSEQVLSPASDNSAVRVREAFAPFRAELETLHTATDRDRTGSELDPRRWLGERPSRFDLPAIRQVAQALALHASAELALGGSEAALKDATALLRVADVLRGEPELVAAMVHVSLTGLYLQVIWEGLAARRWGDEQLRTLQDQLESIDLLAACRSGLEGEQAAINYWLEQTPPSELGGQLVERITAYKLRGRPAPWWAGPVRRGIQWGPRGWVRQLQVGYSEAMQDQFCQLDRAGQQRLLPRHEPVAPSRWWPRVGLLVSIPELIRRQGLNAVQVVKRVGRQQTGVRHALLACLLERYRLAEGTFPESLDALVPGLKDQLPCDLIDGRPFRYSRTRDGLFVIYSPGWDERDDAASGADWVWRYPAR